jgi:hypothetical protein
MGSVLLSGLTRVVLTAVRVSSTLASAIEETIEKGETRRSTCK